MWQRGCHAVVLLRSTRCADVRAVVDIIAAGGVQVSPRYDDFPQVVEGLVDTLIAHDQVGEDVRQSAVRAVCEREGLSSTVMVEIGVSIPHARVDGVEGVVGALAVSHNGVYQAIAQVPIRIVCLVLSSPDLAGDHLNVLAGLSLLLQSQNVRDRLTRADDSSVVIETLREQSGRSGS